MLKVVLNNFRTQKNLIYAFFCNKAKVIIYGYLFQMIIYNNHFDHKLY